MRNLRRVTVGSDAAKRGTVVVVPGEEAAGSVAKRVRAGKGVVAVAVHLPFDLRLKTVRPQVLQGRSLTVRVEGVVLRPRGRSLATEEVPETVLHPLRVFVVDGVTLVRRGSNVGLAHVELAVGRIARLLLLLLRWRWLGWRVGPARRGRSIGRRRWLTEGRSG